MNRRHSSSAAPRGGCRHRGTRSVLRRRHFRASDHHHQCIPPGGANDLVTRPAATALEAALKQPVVVETKAGAAAP